MKPNLKNQMQWCIRAQWTMAIGLLVLIAAIGLLIIRPATTRSIAISRRLALQEGALQAAELREATLPTAEQETEKLRQRVEQFEKKLPRHQGLPQLISDVTQMSRRATLTKLSWRPDPMRRRADEFNEVPVEFSFQGDFLGVFQFLSQLQDMDRLTRLRKLDMQARDGMDGQVEVQLTMNIYFSEE